MTIKENLDDVRFFNVVNILIEAAIEICDDIEWFSDSWYLKKLKRPNLNDIWQLQKPKLWFYCDVIKQYQYIFQFPGIAFVILESSMLEYNIPLNKHFRRVLRSCSDQILKS